jgi:cytochrome bd-type quinol oxidase subunit 1
MLSSSLSPICVVKNFSLAFVEPVLDQVLPIEAALGPVMLAAVATIAALGERLYPTTRMLIMWGLALTMLCQSATILTVNAWMQHPLIAGPEGSSPAHRLCSRC